MLEETEEEITRAWTKIQCRALSMRRRCKLSVRRHFLNVRVDQILDSMIEVDLLLNPV